MIFKVMPLTSQLQQQFKIMYLLKCQDSLRWENSFFLFSDHFVSVPDYVLCVVHVMTSEVVHTFSDFADIWWQDNNQGENQMGQDIKTDWWKAVKRDRDSCNCLVMNNRPFLFYIIEDHHAFWKENLKRNLQSCFQHFFFRKLKYFEQANEIYCQCRYLRACKSHGNVLMCEALSCLLSLISKKRYLVCINFIALKIALSSSYFSTYSHTNNKM